MQNMQAPKTHRHREQARSHKYLKATFVAFFHHGY